MCFGGAWRSVHRPWNLHKANIDAADHPVSPRTRTYSVFACRIGNGREFLTHVYTEYGGIIVPI